MSGPCVIGLDFGTSSARAIVARTSDGAIIASATFDYPSGTAGVITSATDANLARQHPGDYLAAIDALLGQVACKTAASIDIASIVGIGVDATASTPIPVDAALRPLALDAAFAGDPDALAHLWKDHTAHAEAVQITAELTRSAPAHLARCGMTYSSEWFWSKILRVARTNQRVARAAATWVEQSDYIPAVLAGLSDAATMPRNVCAAGHKALYAADLGGYPPVAVLERLHPALAGVRESCAVPAVTSTTPIGTLTAPLAAHCGLSPRVVIAAGGIDAHLGAIGSGVRAGSMVKIMGTSTCDILIAEAGSSLDIPGVCGVVDGSVVPGCLGIEAGQSAVGDLFDWFVRHVARSGSDAAAIARTHEELTREAARLAPGASGLVALDWNNGNRCVLVDPLLSGVLIGQTLHTTAAEIYRALIEATAFGARTIIDRLAEQGTALDTIIVCGGIAEKNPLAMQIYADTIGRPMHVAESSQACALGAAICAAVAAGAHPDMPAAIAAMTRPPSRVLVPNPAATRVYDELFAVYSALHDAFGRGHSAMDLRTAMKQLIAISRQARAAGMPG